MEATLKGTPSHVYPADKRIPSHGISVSGVLYFRIIRAVQLLISSPDVVQSTKPPLTILLAAPRGFCAGVDRAIQIVVLALKKYGAPVYVRHEIVHNRYVVEGLQNLGAVFIEELHEIPPDHRDAPVVFSAHGVPKSVPADAVSRNLFYLDATCPLVSKVHKQALRHQRLEDGGVAGLERMTDQALAGGWACVAGSVGAVRRPAWRQHRRIPCQMSAAPPIVALHTVRRIDDRAPLPLHDCDRDGVGRSVVIARTFRLRPVLDGIRGRRCRALGASGVRCQAGEDRERPRPVGHRQRADACCAKRGRDDEAAPPGKGHGRRPGAVTAPFSASCVR